MIHYEIWESTCSSPRSLPNVDAEANVASLSDPISCMCRRIDQTFINIETKTQTTSRCKSILYTIYIYIDIYKHSQNVPKMEFLYCFTFVEGFSGPLFNQYLRIILIRPYFRGGPLAGGRLTSHDDSSNYSVLFRSHLHPGWHPTDHNEVPGSQTRCQPGAMVT